MADSVISMSNMSTFKNQLDIQYQHNTINSVNDATKVSALSEINDTKSSTTTMYSSDKITKLIAAHTPTLEYATDDDIHAMFASTTETTS